MPRLFGPRQIDSAGSPSCHRFVLWVDGVGSYLLALSDQLTIGGPALNPGEADLALLADLSRRHASIVRTREGYFLEAHAVTRVSDQSVSERTHLYDGCELQLGDRVRLGFRLPSELSASARIDFLSDHRPPHTVDGVVMMDDTCLLGPGTENHIRCRDWPGAVLLYRQGAQLWCKSRLGVLVGGKPAARGVRVHAGDIVLHPDSDLRFRIESGQPQAAHR